MTTAKINFEMDRDVLATAQAFAAKHRVSLNKLVSTYFASLGQEDNAAMPVDDLVSPNSRSFTIDASGNNSFIIFELSSLALSAVATAESTLRRPRQYPRSKCRSSQTRVANGSQWNSGVTQ